MQILQDAVYYMAFCSRLQLYACSVTDSLLASLSTIANIRNVQNDYAHSNNNLRADFVLRRICAHRNIRFVEWKI